MVETDSSKQSARDRLASLLSKGQYLEHSLATAEHCQEDEKIDQCLMQDGIAYFQANFFSMFVCMMTGLLSLMYINSIAVILHLTGKSSSPTLAYQRYLRTMRHTSMWYTGPGVETMIRSLKEVKVKHRVAAKLAMNKGHLMSQYDMVLTQWAFIGPALIFPASLGLPPPPAGPVYIMYLVGRYLGVSEDLNLCSGGVARATEYSKLILKHVFQPAINMENRNTVSKEMSAHLMKGVNMMIPFIHGSAFECWFLRLLSSSKSYPPSQQMGVLSIILLKSQRIMLGTVLHLPVVGTITRLMLNMLMRLAIFLNSDWEDLIIQFHLLADWPGWLLAALSVLTIPVLSFGSALRRVKTIRCRSFILLTLCILFNVTTSAVKPS